MSLLLPYLLMFCGLALAMVAAFVSAWLLLGGSLHRLASLFRAVVVEGRLYVASSIVRVARVYGLGRSSRVRLALFLAGRSA